MQTHDQAIVWLWGKDWATEPYLQKHFYVVSIAPCRRSQQEVHNERE